MQMAATQASFGHERRRGRPSASRAAAIEHGIRSAALDIFAAAGFDAASMDAVHPLSPDPGSDNKD